MAFAWTRKSAPKQAPVVAVERGPILSLISTNATAEPGQWRAVTAAMAGRVSRVAVKPGDRVAAGAAVAVVEQPGIESEIAQARHSLKEAESALALAGAGGSSREKAELDATHSKLLVELDAARRDYASVGRLVAKNAATKAELDAIADRIAQMGDELKSYSNRRASLVEPGAKALAASRVEQARKSLEEVLARQSRLALTAALPGVVFEVTAKPGDWVEPGTVVAKVGDLETMRLRVYVDEPDLGRVAAGMKLKVSWDAIPDRTWEAAVVQVPAQVTAMGTRMVGEVLATMPSPGMRIPAGANLNVELEAERIMDALTIPKESLRRKDAQVGVLVAENGILKWRAIRTGISNLSAVQVISGLKQGDQVVAGGDPELAEGMHVEVVVQNPPR
jgi:HlyD family secretion protein